MTTLSTLSDLVNITPVKTPMHMYLNHRIFRCLGLAGPHVLFSLNPSAGPTRQLHTLFRLPREPSPRATAAPRPYAAAQPPLAHNSSAPPPLPCSATARALQRRACAAPAPCLRHLCAADHAPPPSKSSVVACSASTPSPHAVHLHPPLGSPHAQGTELTVPLPPCALLHSRCSTDCL